MKITVSQNKFHGGNVYYEGKSEAQAIKAARKHTCTFCQCGGPTITREDGKQLYNWEAGKPFVERTIDDEPFWD